MCMVPGYLFGLTQMDSTQPFSVSDDIGDAVVYLVVDLPLTYIAFGILALIGLWPIRSNSRNVYPIAGALIGLSVITGLLWVLVGMIVWTGSGNDTRAVQINGILVVVIAPIAALAAAVVGAVLGKIYQLYRIDPPSENGTKTPNTDTNGRV